MVFITLQSIGENEYGKTGHSKFFTFLRQFMIILKGTAVFYDDVKSNTPHISVSYNKELIKYAQVVCAHIRHSLNVAVLLGGSGFPALYTVKKIHGGSGRNSPKNAKKSPRKSEKSPYNCIEFNAKRILEC